MNKRAFSLVETLIYATILAVASVLVVGALLRIGPVYVKAQNLRKVNAAGSFAVDRIVREMRKGINFQYSNGELTFNSQGTFEDFVRKDGAVSYYNFEETSGGKLYDQIGSNNSIAFSVSPPTQNQLTVVGRGYKFDNTELIPQYVQLPDNAFPFNIGAIEVIFRFDQGESSDIGSSMYSSYNDYRIFAVGSGADTLADVAHGLLAGNLISGQFYCFDSGSCALFKTSRVYSLGTYYHVVYEVTSANANLYVNGVLQKSGNQTPVFLSYATQLATQHNRIGHKGSKMDGSDIVSGSRPFKGIIDELAIYNAPKDVNSWRAHYKAAFGLQDNSGDTIIQRKINTSLDTATNKYSLNYSPSGSSVPLTSTNDVNVTNFSVNVIKLQSSDPSGIGAEITFSVTAGSGPSAVTRTFKTAAVGRKTN